MDLTAEAHSLEEEEGERSAERELAEESVVGEAQELAIRWAHLGEAIEARRLWAGA